MSFIGRNPTLTTLKFNGLSTAPSSPTEGMTYYDTGAGSNSEGFYKYQNSVWEPIGSNADYLKLNSKSADPTSPAEGQIFYANGTSRPEGLYVYNGTQWVTVGSSGGGINYISNPDFEGGTTGYSLYADAAGIIPVDGTGGSATSTFTASATAPLRGLKSLIFSKPASNEQGEGFSYDFTIDSADQNNMLEVSFDYDASDADYLDDYMSIFIYDVTNAQLIRFNGEELKAKTKGKFLAFFQTASNSTSYRLIFHVVTSTTTAIDLKFDNIKVGPNSDVSMSNTNITTWTSHPTPTFNGFGTPTAVEIQTRKVGQNLEMRGKFTCGTTTAAEARVGFPNGYISAGTGIIPSLQIAGLATRDTNSSGPLSVLIEPSVSYVTFGYANLSSTNMLTKYNGSAIASSGEKFSFFVSIPISTFTAADVTSADYSGRLVFSSGAGNGGTSLTANTTNIDFTETSDTSGSFDGTTFTAPESGYYEFEGAIKTTASISGSIYTYIDTVKTKLASSPAISTTLLHFSGKEYLTKGQAFTLRSDFAATLSNSTTDHHFAIQKTANPVDVVKSNERVYVDYIDNNNDSVASDTGVTTFKTKIEDTHSAWNGTKFTCPISGVYHVQGNIQKSASTSSRANLWKNGTFLHNISANGITGDIVDINCMLKLVKGDYIEVRTPNGYTLATNAGTNHYIHIVKISN